MTNFSAFAQSVGRPGTTAEAEVARLHRQRGGHVLDLRGMGLLDGRLPVHVTEEAARAASNTKEAPSDGLPELREAISAKVWKENGIKADPDTEVLVTTGAKQAIFVAMAALLNPGDEVMLHSPNYVFDGSIQIHGAVPVHIPTSMSEGFRLDLAGADRLVNSRTRLLILCNPVNPTGHLPTAQEVEEFGRFAQRHKLVVVADESYEKYVYDGKRTVSLGSYPEWRGHVITIHSFSKSYALAPYRIGYLIGPADVVSVCRRVMEWMNIYLNFVSQRAAWAALTGPQEWVSRMIHDWQVARDRFLDIMASVPQLHFCPPQATGSVFLNIAPYGRPSLQVSQFLLQEYGVPSVPGNAFYGEGYIRLCFGATASVQDELVETLKRSVRDQVLT